MICQRNSDASKSFIYNRVTYQFCKNVCLRNDNSVSAKTNPIGITAIPSAEMQILTESRQFRQRKDKSCRNYGNSVSGKANPVGITAIPSAEPQILSESRQFRQRNHNSVGKMTLQTAKPLKQSEKGLFHRFCGSANRKAESTPEIPHF
ncbi:MAG: hypothetical protein NTY74_17095 [Ignavibacteriae bacterium]|nr:hypothetical protein [Ignavibacteriota bacterium]